MSEQQPPQPAMPRPGGTARVARLLGIDVHVHWAWILVVLVEVQLRRGSYSSVLWNVAEVLSLFGMVLLHEFGHALACRSVGGQAEHIMLWPLGGIAYVRPPPRPGALLWSIAAGPLVNVALVPVTVGAALAAHALLPEGDTTAFFDILAWVNGGLLVFNLLPIYPLDGGQILQALLWFVLGRGRSLLVAAGVGLLAAAGAAVLAVTRRDLWLGLLAWFGAASSWRGIRIARHFRELAAMPRHADLNCPQCGESPPAAALRVCSRCREPFDTFSHGARCPSCGDGHEHTMCPYCARWSRFQDFR